MPDQVYAVIYVWKGIIEEVRVTDEHTLALRWRDEMDQAHGIVRDSSGGVEGDDNDEVILTEVCDMFTKYSYRF